MEKITIDNFRKIVEEQLESVVIDYMKSLNPNPVEVLDVIDDFLINWGDSGGDYHAEYYIVTGYRSQYVMSSKLSDKSMSTNSKKFDLNSIDLWTDKNSYGHGFYKIKIRNLGTKPPRGSEYWNILNPMIMAIGSDYRVSMPFGKIDCHSISSSGSTHSFSAKLENLKDELSRIQSMEFVLKIQ